MARDHLMNVTDMPTAPFGTRTVAIIIAAAVMAFGGDFGPAMMRGRRRESVEAAFSAAKRSTS